MWINQYFRTISHLYKDNIILIVIQLQLFADKSRFNGIVQAYLMRNVNDFDAVQAVSEFCL